MELRRAKPDPNSIFSQPGSLPLEQYALSLHGQSFELCNFPPLTVVLLLTKPSRPRKSNPFSLSLNLRLSANQAPASMARPRALQLDLHRPPSSRRYFSFFSSNPTFLTLSIFYQTQQGSKRHVGTWVWLGFQVRCGFFFVYYGSEPHLCVFTVEEWGWYFVIVVRKVQCLSRYCNSENGVEFKLCVFVYRDDQ